MADRFLEGRSAWVTGGATGQGRAIALALAGAGADVGIGSFIRSGSDEERREDVYHASADEMARVRAEIEAHGVRAFARELDVRSADAVRDFHRACCAAIGEIDILVNAAGTSVEQPIVDHPLELWHKLVDTNLNGAFYTTRACFGGMVERGWGRIINIASTYSIVGDRNYAAYCASKAGLLGLTRCTALEGAAHGVTCNAISPGYCNTGMIRATFDTWAKRDKGQEWVVSAKPAKPDGRKAADDYLADVAATYPQGRLIEPEETAALVLFLCSSGARGLTMENIRLSGGSLF